MPAPDIKFFFFVAGYDYSHKELDYDRNCTGRVAERIDFVNRTFKAKDALVKAPAKLRFLRFNVGTGKVEVIERELLEKKGIGGAPPRERDWQPLSSIGGGDAFDPSTFVSPGPPFRAIDRLVDYPDQAPEYPRFDQARADAAAVMSITDVYDSLRRAPAGSVLELSFFSHGWIQGPILVNSSDLRSDPMRRDPTDKDGRALLDFNLFMGADALDPTNLGKFAAAFDPKGMLRSWGCSHEIQLPVILQVQRRLHRGGVVDATMIDLEFEPRWATRYVTDPEFFGRDPAVLHLSRSFADVKKYLRRSLGRSYAYQAALTTGKLGLGPLPGTEGDDEKTGFRLMHVCAKKQEPDCPVGYAPLFDFYRRQIGVATGDRGYALFDTDTVARLQAAIAADAGP